MSEEITVERVTMSPQHNQVEQDRDREDTVDRMESPNQRSTLVALPSQDPGQMENRNSQPTSASLPSPSTSTPCNDGVVRKQLSSTISSTTQSLTDQTPSIVKRSRASLIRELAAPLPAYNIPTKLIHWAPIQTELDWNTIKGSPSPRMGHRAVMLNSKMIIFSGGNQEMFQDLLVFDTDTKTWSKPQQNGTVPEGRASYGMETLGNYIYIFGGLLEYGYYTNEIFRLDVTSWTWQKLKPGGLPPCPRLGHSFTRVNDSFYVFGGLTDDTNIPPQMEFPRYLGDFFKLNVAHNSNELFWESPYLFGSIPGARESHSAVATSVMRYNRLIIYGGMCGRRLNDLYFLDVDTCIWTKPTVRGIPPTPRSMHSANLIDNCMYVFGGWRPASEHPEVVGESRGDIVEVQKIWKVTNELHCLNFETLTWEQVAQRENQVESSSYWPKPRAGHCAVAGKTRIYIWGGKDGFNLDEMGKQSCFSEMLGLEVDKPLAVPGKVMLAHASYDTLTVQWERVEDADSYLLQCCPYDLPMRDVPVATPTPTAVPPPPSKNPAIKRKAEPYDGRPIQQPPRIIPSQQSITQIFPFSGPLPQSLPFVPNTMPLVLSNPMSAANGQNIQFGLSTGQVIAVQPQQPQSFQQQHVINPQHLIDHQLFYKNINGFQRLVFMPEQNRPAFTPFPLPRPQQHPVTYFHQVPPSQVQNVNVVEILPMRMPLNFQQVSTTTQFGLTRLANAAALAQRATTSTPVLIQPLLPYQPPVSSLKKEE